MPMDKTLFLLGYASDVAGVRRGSADGPLTLQQSPYFLALEEKLDLRWEAILKSNSLLQASPLQQVKNLCHALADKVANILMQKHFFVVVGGDHTSEIG